MKTKLFTLLAMLSIALFSSCSKDDDISIAKESLVGTWDVTSVDGDSLTSGYVYVVISNDNTYIQKWFTNTYYGTYSISGSTMKGKIDGVNEKYVFTSLTDDYATISYSNDIGASYKFEAAKR